MNIHKLLRKIEGEQNFEDRTKDWEPELRYHEAVRLGITRTKDKIYTPFSARLKTGFHASIHLHGHPIEYFINDKVVSATCNLENIIKVKKIARCHSEDKFDLKRGIVIATARLMRDVHQGALNYLTYESNLIKKENADICAMLYMIDKEGVEFSFKKGKK